MHIYVHLLVQLGLNTEKMNAFTLLEGLLLYLNNKVTSQEQTLPALSTHFCWDTLHKPAAPSNILLPSCIVVKPGQHIAHMKLQQQLQRTKKSRVGNTWTEELREIMEVIK